MEGVDPGTLDRSTSARDVLLDMELRRGRLRHNLQASLRAAIQDGRLGAGTVLPASRRLAADLRVSRGVVTDAYDQLAAEGYLHVDPRQPPRVAELARHADAGPAERVPAPSWEIDFIGTTPEIELFPRRAWLRAVERTLRDAPNEALDYADHRGRIELRLALAAYLARVRGVRTDPDRIVVTTGFTQALDLLSRVLHARGSTTIAFETPSLADEWETVRASDLRVEACPVDLDGLVTNALAAVRSRAIVVTPAHQFPTGAVLAPHRRSELMAWAANGDRLVVEDDYDAEFRYDRSAIGALQGLDPERVVHVGTASKTLAPAVRLAWMSLPADLVDEVRVAKAAADSGSPAIDQLVLADLIASGAYDRQIAQARHVYRRRRDRLMAALARRLPDFAVRGAAAGLHVLLDLPAGLSDVEVSRAAAERGIRVRPLSPLSLVRAPDQGLVLGYGRLEGERIDAAVDALASVLDEV